MERWNARNAGYVAEHYISRTFLLIHHFYFCTQGRIGKYYAVEDMLTTDPSEKYGTITMQEHYNKIAAEGQDKFTPVRATALIGRWIESFPLIAAAHVPLFGYLTNPKAVQTMGGTSGLDLGFILASTHNLVI